MKPLQPPDSIHLRAAEGWLELGNPGEAAAELELIQKKHRGHLDVLEVRWHIHAKSKQWETCLKVATLIKKQAPNRTNGWLHLSYALHELQRTAEAWDNLFAVAEKFPGEPTLAYNLACYAAQLGKLWEAEQWMKHAFKLSEPKALKPVALADADLKPIWHKIKDL